MCRALERVASSLVTVVVSSLDSNALSLSAHTWSHFRMLEAKRAISVWRHPTQLDAVEVLALNADDGAYGQQQVETLMPIRRVMERLSTAHVAFLFLKRRRAIADIVALHRISAVRWKK